MAGNNQKHVKSFLQSPEPGLHRISYTKMSGVLLDQIEEEGLNLPMPFGTAETRQERGGRGSHQAHEGHADYLKFGQHGHAHVYRKKPIAVNWTLPLPTAKIKFSWT